MNFVFDAGGRLFIGTAGHCVEEGQEVVILTLNPGSSEAVLVNIGVTVASHNRGIGDDFAVVAIRPELHDWVSATTAVISGPCGRHLGSGIETVAHYGHGLAVGTGGTPRVGVALTWTEDAFGWSGVAIFGDSGSPVRVTDLAAAGDLTHLVVDDEWIPSYIAGTRISKMLDIVKGLSLVNSPLCLFGEDDSLEASFRRGDTNDDGSVDVSDPVFTLKCLFRAGRLPDCQDSADANDDGRIDISDPIYTLNFLFNGGRRFPPPHPDPGPDPTEDGIDC